jgi:hypothetical protein
MRKSVDAKKRWYQMVVRERGWILRPNVTALFLNPLECLLCTIISTSDEEARRKIRDVRSYAFIRRWHLQTLDRGEPRKLTQCTLRALGQR